MTTFSMIRNMGLAIALGLGFSLAGPALAQKKYSESHLAVAKELVIQAQIAKTFSVFVPQLGIRLLNSVA